MLNQFHQSGAYRVNERHIVPLPVETVTGREFEIVNGVVYAVKVILVEIRKQYQMPDGAILTALRATPCMLYL
jgi:hypothetical protein